MTVVKRIFRYLKGTRDCRLWYKKDDEFIFKVYVDAYWVDNVDDRKITRGGSFFLGERLIT